MRCKHENSKHLTRCRDPGRLLQLHNSIETIADVLRTFKRLVSIQKFWVKFKYVQSHADDTKKWKDCTLKEQINIKVDSLAKKALKSAHYTGEFIEGTFPNEQIWITMGEKKATGSLCLELEEYWGRSSARIFFHAKIIVLSAHFDSIW